jgi:hypothetical protein
MDAFSVVSVVLADATDVIVDEECGEIFPVFVGGGGVVYHPIWICNVSSITASDCFLL